MIGSILLGLAWFALLFLIAIIVQELADIRATLETVIKEFRTTFVEFKVDETKEDVSEDAESRE